MKTESRIKNTARNFLTGAMSQLIKVLMGFVGRTVFIYTLGQEYLGLDGLFTSVLTILSLSELGVGSGIVYCLYRPLALGDTGKIQAYMRFYKKAYFIIGCVVAGAGICLIPCLPVFLKGSTELVDVNLLYLLYLFQSVCSYWFFAYRSSIITADQKNSVLSRISCIVIPLTTAAQMLELFLLKDFIGYVITGICGNILNNVLIAVQSQKMYPEIFKKNHARLSKEEKGDLFRKIRGLAMYKFSGTVLTSTDNLIISGWIGTAVLGIYSNYTLLFGYVNAIPTLLFGSLTASLGNVNAVESVEKKEDTFRKISFLNFWIYGFCGIAMLCLINPFIRDLWVGEHYLLSQSVVFLLFFNFITMGLQQTVIAHKDACGLFWEGRWRPVLSGGLNLLLSAVLVIPFGVEGVLAGTIISRFATTWWFDPWLVYKYAFRKTPRGYYKTYLARLLLITGTGLGTWLLTERVPWHSWYGFGIKALICCVIPNVIFWAVSRKNPEYIYYRELGKNLIRRRRIGKEPEEPD